MLLLVEVFLWCLSMNSSCIGECEVFIHYLQISCKYWIREVAVPISSQKNNIIDYNRYKTVNSGLFPMIYIYIYTIIWSLFLFECDLEMNSFGNLVLFRCGGWWISAASTWRRRWVKTTTCTCRSCLSSTVWSDSTTSSTTSSLHASPHCLSLQTSFETFLYPSSPHTSPVAR